MPCRSLQSTLITNAGDKCIFADCPHARWHWLCTGSCCAANDHKRPAERGNTPFQRFVPGRCDLSLQFTRADHPEPAVSREKQPAGRSDPLASEWCGSSHCPDGEERQVSNRPDPYPHSVSSCLVVRHFVWRTLEKVMQFAVYLEGEKNKTERVRIGRTERTPPVCHELACRSISLIIPQNRLLSSSCLTPDQVRNGVRHCLLPQRIPNLLLCWKRPALPHPNLVFCLRSPHGHRSS